MGAADMDIREFLLASRDQRAAMGAASGTVGGDLVPQGFREELAVALKAYAVIASGMSRFEDSSVTTVVAPTLDVTGTTGAVQTENAQITTENDLTFGQASLGSWTYSSGVQLVSRQLIADSAFPVDGVLV